MGQWYRLNEQGEPEACDALGWSNWRSENENEDPARIAYTKIGEFSVSTVFLGLDHCWGGGPPILWETMIFGGEHADYQERYTSRADAVAGHEEAVKLATNGQNY